MKYIQICRAIGGITQSRASKLCSIGIEKVQTDEKYRTIMDELIEKCKAA